MTTAILVGNPKPRSRTYEAAGLIVERLTREPPDVSFDLADIAPALLEWSDPTAKELISALQGVDIVVVASPTSKATYTGLLKLFLDRVDAGALVGTTAVPLMLGGDWRHSLAPEVFLKPVLTEIGLSCPTRGLFLLDSDYATSAVLEEWLQRASNELAPVLERA
jgi:FMN reductase